MIYFRLKQKKIEDFLHQKRNSLGFTDNFLKWYLKEWKQKKYHKTKRWEN
jgi:hypothetical protein